MAKKDGQRRKEQAETSPTASPDGQETGLKRKEYRVMLAELQCNLFNIQQWIAGEGRRLVIVLEGLGPAGKKGIARRITEGLDRRVCKIVALDTPSKRERGQWRFQRFVEHFPIAGRLTIFDGSWYHIPAIERALGVSTDADFSDFLNSCNDFELMLTRSGISLVKYWLTAADDLQERRFREHMAEASKAVKSYWASQPPVSQPKPVAEVRQAIVQATNVTAAPWYVIQQNDRRQARLDCISHLLSLVPNQDLVTPGLSLVLPKNSKPG